MTARRAPLPILRLGHLALGLAAPGLAGRIATDLFTSTRGLRTCPDDVLPLGARRFEVPGAPDLRGGYLWGADGPAALLVHGWGADSSHLHGLVAPLLALGYRVAAFDAPGHGVAAGKRATMTQFAVATRAVVDALGDVRLIVAHSLGSIAAIGAAAWHPRPPVERLILIAPTCTLTGVLERWSRSDLALRRSIVDRVRRELHRRNGMPLAYWDVIRLGASLVRPILVIHDPQDAVVPFSEAEAIAAGLPDVNLEAVPGPGHLGILMAPVVKDLVTAFAARRASGDPV